MCFHYPEVCFLGEWDQVWSGVSEQVVLSLVCILTIILQKSHTKVRVGWDGSSFATEAQLYILISQDKSAV
jgi:hypothetical protein